MAKKQLSSEELRSRLTVGHFGDAAAQELPPGDPLTVTQMVLEIDRIQPYDGNPRRQRNPQYDEIKASIRAQKRLNNAIEVTRRPDDDVYMVRAGGNTRLQILKELYEETGDEAYRRVHVLYHPWTSDQDVLGAHLVENEMRGTMTLIDRALAVDRLREMFEEAGESLSRKELQRRLQDIGYTASLKLLRRFEYASKTLLPCIPQALHGGLGGQAIEKLRDLHRSAHAVGESHGHTQDAVDMVFEESLAVTDAPDWDPGAARQELERRLAEELSLDLRTVRMELDTPPTQDSEGATGPANMPPDMGAMGQPTPPVHDASPDGAPGAPPGRSGTATDPVIGDGAGAGDPPPAAPPVTAPTEPAPGPAPTVAELRDRIYTLARQIATRYHYAEQIQPVDIGYGYFIDLPSETVEEAAARMNGVEIDYRHWTWWLLVSWSQIGLHTDRVLQTAPTHRLASVIHRADEEEVIARHIAEPSWRGLGWMVSSCLREPDFADFVALVQACRDLQRQADADDLDPWEG
ncbi:MULTISPECIES: ParB family protein [unclassified Thioalkalivibrio]|uniref:ParB family protein n=1 Tax=unclassified Thioalkalivibrio TaxID=2621013 RepID=UPI00037AD6DF|nr:MULTISPECIES: ParB family protein [unclassified Thioalkalivibrio]